MVSGAYRKWALHQRSLWIPVSGLPIICKLITCIRCLDVSDINILWDGCCAVSSTVAYGGLMLECLVEFLILDQRYTNSHSFYS